MRVLVGAVAALILVLALAPGPARAQGQVEGELNQGKAAMQLKRYDEAAARLGKLARAGNPVAPLALKWAKVATAKGFPDPLRAGAGIRPRSPRRRPAAPPR